MSSHSMYSCLSPPVASHCHPILTVFLLPAPPSLPTYLSLCHTLRGPCCRATSLSLLRQRLAAAFTTAIAAACLPLPAQHWRHTPLSYAACHCRCYRWHACHPLAYYYYLPDLLPCSSCLFCRTACAERAPTFSLASRDVHMTAGVTLGYSLTAR